MRFLIGLRIFSHRKGFPLQLYLDEESNRMLKENISKYVNNFSDKEN